MADETTHQACDRIFREWHERARAKDAEGLAALYAQDAIVETPLAPAIDDGRATGVLAGRAEIRAFLEEGGRRRPDELVRWYRTGRYLTDGRMLFWEYPRQTPDGDQIEIAEVMEIEDGLIARHRIYWGWRGCLQIAPALSRVGAG